MTEREELEGLKRLAELEAKASGQGGPPVDLSAQAAEMAAKDVGTGEALAISAGRGFDKLAVGLKQLVMEGAKRGLPPIWAKAAAEELSQMQAQEAEKDAAYKPLAAKRPFITGIGEAAPYVAVPASAGVLPAAAIVGAAEAAKYGTPQERAARGALGAGTTAAGGLLARGAAGLISPVTQKTAAPAAQGALEAAERIGMKPRLSEATGRPLIARLEDYAARAPGGAGVMQDFAQANQTAINRAAAKSIGETADELTPEVFAAATGRLGSTFEAIKGLKGTPIQIGSNVGKAADEVLASQSKALKPDPELVMYAQQAKMWAANRGKIDGETYQLLRSGLTEATFDAAGTNKTLYGKLLTALDDTADASLRAGGQDALADALKTVRPQYANLKLLEKGTTAEAGNVSPARVASAMRTQNPGAFRRGDFVGPLADVARVGEGMKPLRAGSPTAEREMVGNPLSVVANALWSYPVARATTSPLMTWYPRTLGNTAAARGTAAIAEPSSRAAIAAALQQAGLLPIMAE